MGHILDCMEKSFIQIAFNEFKKNISWINSKRLYVVIYFNISTCTFVHLFRDSNMHCECCALCITESDLFLVPKNCGFLKTELLWIHVPNFRDGPEAVRFSQIILYIYLLESFQLECYWISTGLYWEIFLTLLRFPSTSNMEMLFLRYISSPGGCRHTHLAWNMIIRK